MRRHQKLLGNKFLDWLDMDVRQYEDITTPRDKTAVFRVDEEHTLYLGTDKPYYGYQEHFACLTCRDGSPPLIGYDKVKNWLQHHDNAQLIAHSLNNSDHVHLALDKLLHVACEDLGLDPSSYDVAITVTQID